MPCRNSDGFMVGLMLGIFSTIFISLMFLSFVVPKRRDFEIEAVKAGAGKFVADEKGEVKFEWIVKQGNI